MQPSASLTLDILLPARADVPAARARALSEAAAAGFVVVDKLADDPPRPSIFVELASLSDLGWSGVLPRYFEVYPQGIDTSSVFTTSGVLRVRMRGPSTLAFASLTKLWKLVGALATEQKAWIYESYRAQIFEPKAFEERSPDLDALTTLVRVIGVTSTPRPSRVRTMGFARLGLPELRIPGVVPEADIQDARYLMTAAARTHLKRGALTGPGRFVVDMATLEPTWSVTKNGTGTFEFAATWATDENSKLVIELTLPDAPDDPSAFAAALHRFVIARP